MFRKSQFVIISPASARLSYIESAFFAYLLSFLFLLSYILSYVLLILNLYILIGIVFVFFYKFVKPCFSVQLLIFNRLLIRYNNFLNCISGLVLQYFILSRFLLWPYNITITSNLIFVHSFMQL